MSMSGRVVGGQFLNGTVTAVPYGTGLVVQSGFKRRKLNQDHVAAWEEIVSESNGGKASAVGQAVAAVALPRFMSKSASAAVGAALNTTIRPPHIVRINWLVGEPSLLKVSDQLFTHLDMILKGQRVEPVPAPAGSAVAEAAPVPTVTEQAFSLVSGFLKDRKAVPVVESTIASAPDVADQLVKLASLRDAGVLTEEEFAAKKTELLSRM